jgi:hypothetical protein
MVTAPASVPQKGSVVAWPDVALAGILAHFGCMLAVLLVFAVRALIAGVGPGLVVVLAGGPLAVIVAGTALAVAFHRHPARSPARTWRAWAAVAVVLGMAIADAHQVVDRQLLWHLIWAMVAAGVVRLAPAIVRRRAPGWTVLIVLVAGWTLLLSTVGDSGNTRLNDLGLVAGEPGLTRTETYDDNPSKDNYPPCTFAFNSLGYRDREPDPADAGRSTVLLVGDSFVWGDGIPTADETLGNQLRLRLEERAPGRWRVVSAGWPGLGLYGYSRIVDELVPRVRPAAVVISELPQDHDPLDPQFLVDLLATPRILLDMAIRLGVAQHIHQTSVLHYGWAWDGTANLDRFQALGRRLMDDAAAGGYRLLFLHFHSTPGHVPTDATFLTLPDELRYPGQSNEFWYARDAHPKPALDRKVADLLAAWLAP